MRVLWITNIPVAEHRKMLGLPLNQSGGWIEASYAAIKNNKNLTLGVVTTYAGNDIKRGQDGHHSFYVIPCIGNRVKDISDNSQNRHLWRIVMDDFNPDCIHLWGTEFSHGLCALKVAQNIPAVVYIQGMMSQIAFHFLDGISLSDQILSTTLRDIVLRQCYWNLSKRQKIRACIEEQIIKRVQGVIVENRWCSGNCRLINKDIKVFKSLLPVNPIFAEYQWTVDNMQPHSIFTVAGNSPIKGFHVLLKTLSLLVERYPDVKVYVPGGSNRSIRRSSYYKYTQNLINKYNLKDHIVYLGRLSPKEMAMQMAVCNVFVMPSSIENHSSTLIEAMMVGTPCVSSYVGGVSDYLIDGVNGLFYRFDEYQTAASQIMRIFDNRNLSIELSENARNKTRNDRINIDLVNDFITCYNSVIR